MAHKRLNISLPEETEKLLRLISKETGLKMSTVIDKAIKLFKKENK